MKKPRAQPTPEALAMKERSIERLRHMRERTRSRRALPKPHPDCERCREMKRRAREKGR